MKDRLAPSAVDSDMNWRFEEGDWRTAGGNIQSLIFYGALMQILYGTGLFPQQDLTTNKALGFDWHDYGCAEGDGLAYIHAVLPGCTLKGFDISRVAVANAQARWPTLDFAVGDVRFPDEEADLISSLHTLEHLPYPVNALRMLVSKARRAVIAITPVITPENNGGHVGAQLTKDYDTEVMDTFNDNIILHTTYRTFRRIEDEEEGIPSIMNELNNLWVIKGRA